MNKFFEKLEQRLTPISEFASNNRILKSISDGFGMALPIIMIGAISGLFSGLEIGNYQEIIANLGIAPLLQIPVQFTTNALAIFVVFCIAFKYAQHAGHKDDAPIVGLLALLSFLIITPFKMEVVDGFPAVDLPMEWLGAPGLFMAIIVALVTASIYGFVVSKNWTFKLPEGVPPTIAKSFAAMVPSFIIMIVFLAINGFFTNVMHASAHEVLYSAISKPLESLSGNLGTFIVLSLLTSVLWFFGLHGAMITMPFQYMLFLGAGIENNAAYAAKQPMLHILTPAFNGIIILGGVGATLSLSILMLTVSKSQRYKSLGKLSIAPALTGINEPVVFGFPMVLNPVMVLPFVLVPVINILITYFVMSIGVVGKPRLPDMILGTPVFLDGFLNSGFAAIFLQVGLIALDMLLYYPFFRMEDRKAYREETK